MNTGKNKIGNLPVFLFLVLLVACAPATPASTTQVVVTKITESDLVEGQITQTKAFNQCDSANPIKLEIQFGDNVSETSQQELVLGGKIAGGADIPTIAKLEIEGSLEQHFASSKSSGSNHQESVGIEIPAFTRQEYTIVWKETRREGTVEYTEDGEAKVTDFSYRIGLEFFASSVKNIDCSLPTETPLPVVPTASPVSETPSTLPAGALDEGCINPQFWTPISDEAGSASPILNGCYSIENSGIFADPQGTLHLYKRDQKNAEMAGIYTDIPTNYSIIEFNIYVNSMYIADALLPAYVSFTVAPANDPMTAKSSARFRLFVEKPGNDPAVLFMMADVGENNGVKITTQHYEYSRTYRIRLELVGGLMRVYINDLKMNESLSIPDGAKVFYIGYTLPALAGMDVEVSNIRIDGVRK